MGAEVGATTSCELIPLFRCLFKWELHFRDEPGESLRRGTCKRQRKTANPVIVFPFSTRHIPYLESTHRSSIAVQAQTIAGLPSIRNLLRADEGAHYDEQITIDLSTLEPHVNGPNTPDLSTPLSVFSQAVKDNKWPETVSAGLIGSCTNSSYQDMTRAEDLVKQANAAGLKPATDFFITPGSEQIRATLARDQTLNTFEEAGGIVLANACGVRFPALGF